MDDKNKKIIELTPQNAIYKGFETPPEERHAGGGEPDIETDKIRMYVGTTPIAFDLKKLFKKLNKEIPAEVQIFRTYNAFILNHTVGVIKEGGWEKIKQIGYRMKFKQSDDVIVLDVMPQTKFVKNIDGHFNFAADLNMNGELSIPSEITKLINQVDGLGLGGKLQMSSDNGIVGRFSFSIVTPEVQSIGKGSKYSEWVFNAGEKPLYGDDIEMFQIILVNRFMTEIAFDAAIYSTIRTNWISSRRDSDWINLACNLI